MKVVGTRQIKYKKGTGEWAAREVYGIELNRCTETGLPLGFVRGLALLYPMGEGNIAHVVLDVGQPVEDLLEKMADV